VADRGRDVERLAGELEHVRTRARELAGQVEGIVGGSAMQVDRELLAALMAIERSMRAATEALHRIPKPR
jgi:hypothetical protein